MFYTIDSPDKMGGLGRKGIRCKTSAKSNMPFGRSAVVTLNTEQLKDNNPNSSETQIETFRKKKTIKLHKCAHYFYAQSEPITFRLMFRLEVIYKQ